MLYGGGLQVIALPDDRVVLKRGRREILLDGESALPLCRELIPLLDRTRGRDEILALFPATDRGTVNEILDALISRSLVVDGTGALSVHEDELQAAFYDTFGAIGEDGADRIRAAAITIVGINLISRSLVRSLLELGIGSVTLVEDPVLDNELMPVRWAHEKALDSVVPNAHERLVIEPADAIETALESTDLVIASSDFIGGDALLDVNRRTLARGVPFLPIWLEDMIGFVGPLNHPGETACLRCARLRADSNDLKHEISGLVRLAVADDPEARRRTPLLPPMVAILGEVAAMEVAKHLSGFAPSDIVGRAIEINLISFQSTVRRVLKIPRCPDCSERTAVGTRVSSVGPQIPYEPE